MPQDAARSPQGATQVEDQPKGATEIGGPKKTGFLNKVSDVSGQFISGVDDVTKLLAKPFESLFGTVVIGSDGIQYLSPEETAQASRENLIGLPGRTLEEPTSLIGKGLRFAGQSAAVGPLLGRAFGFIPKPTPAITKLGRFGQLPQKIAATAGKTFKRAPITSTAIETGLGFTSGAGGYISGQVFPDSDAAVLIGEIAGGTAPALMPISLAVRASGGIRNLINKVRRPFTPEGGHERAVARVQRAAAPEQRTKALKELDLPTTIDPETGKPVLTIAARSEVPGLLSLERAVMDSSEELNRLGDTNISHANEVIQKSLSNVSTAPSAAAPISIKQSQDYLSGLLETRLRIAAQRADERIAELGPKSTREQLNRIAGEEIDSALTAARAQEKSLFDAIPDSTAVPFSKTEGKYASFLRQLGKPQQEDIPSIARRFLSKKSGDYFGKNRPAGFRTNETKIKELRALQSKLRQEARNARSGDKKNLNKARIADELASSINDDLAEAAAGSEVADQISMAVEFSRDLNERFGTNAMAKILGRRATGAQRVPAGLTLEETIGVTGPKARESLDEILKAFDSPEAPSSKLLIDASEDFLRTKFMKSAIVNGELNVRAAQRFILQNEEILKRLPKVRQQIDEAISAGDSLALIQQQQKTMLDDAKVSKATMLINKGPVETFKQISTLQPLKQKEEIHALINKVAGDETGDALKGLKSGFIEFLYSGAKKGARDVQGRRAISGFTLKEITEKSQVVMKELFTPDELKRIDIITKDFIRIEKRVAANVATEGIIGDRPGTIVRILSQISGARFGSLVSRKLGGGGIEIPRIFSVQFRRLAEAGVSDPAGRLLRDMITDEDLFKELLQSNLKEGGAKLTRVATRRLNAWTASVIAEYGGAFEEDDMQIPIGVTER